MGKGVKLNVTNNVSVQWALKGSYRLEYVLRFIEIVPTQPCSFLPEKCKIFTLDDYSAHFQPEVKKALKKKGYLLVILLGGITGDLQVNDTDVCHPFKPSRREKELLLMIEKLQENPEKIPSHIHSAFKRNGLTIKTSWIRRPFSFQQIESLDLE